VVFALLLLGPLVDPAVGAEPTSTSSGFTCKVVFGSTPSALQIPNAAPNTTLQPGDQLIVAFEYQAQNFSTAMRGIPVEVPTTLALFPQPGGTDLRVYGAARTIDVPGPNWTGWTNGSAVHSINASVGLSGTSPAWLTTQKLAVMATTPYGTLRLAFRWAWSIRTAAGAFTNGSFSATNMSAFHPTVFDPAPYVRLLGTSGPTGVIGRNASMDLGGAITNDSFFLELEHADTGVVVETRSVPGATSNASPLNVGMWLESRDRDLSAGPMLVHVHNHCGAMLYSVGVRAGFAPNASVRVNVVPARCGPIDLNRTAVASGSTIVMVPSASALGISAGACPGTPFSHWRTEGALDLTSAPANTTTVEIGYNGTLTAQYS
jgi:hypothetical protein